MLYRLFLSLILLVAAMSSLAAGDMPDRDKINVPDCTWQPFKIFTNGYVKAPSESAKDEPLYLRKEPSYAIILPDTGPFDWTNPACNLWPGMQLRIADWRTQGPLRQRVLRRTRLLGEQDLSRRQPDDVATVGRVLGAA